MIHHPFHKPMKTGIRLGEGADTHTVYASFSVAGPVANALLGVHRPLQRTGDIGFIDRFSGSSAMFYGLPRTFIRTYLTYPAELGHTEVYRGVRNQR